MNKNECSRKLTKRNIRITEIVFKKYFCLRTFNKKTRIKKKKVM